MTTLVLVGLTHRPVCFTHFASSFSAAYMISLAVPKSFPTVITTICIRYGSNVLFLEGDKHLFTSISDPRGDKTPPCGVPLVALLLIELLPSSDIIVLPPRIL